MRVVQKHPLAVPSMHLGKVASTAGVCLVLGFWTRTLRSRIAIGAHGAAGGGVDVQPLRVVCKSTPSLAHLILGWLHLSHTHTHTVRRAATFQANNMALGQASVRVLPPLLQTDVGAMPSFHPPTHTAGTETFRANACSSWPAAGSITLRFNSTCLKW
jgi:hypothetical protein